MILRYLLVYVLGSLSGAVGYAICLTASYELEKLGNLTILFLLLTVASIVSVILLRSLPSPTELKRLRMSERNPSSEEKG